MLDTPDTHLLAALFAEARRSGRPLAALPPNLAPADAGTADAVQEATARLLAEPIAGYKVAQVGDAAGSWGFITASRLLPAPARIHPRIVPQIVPGGTGLKIELEVAFRLERDLAGRADGRPYAAAEVAEAIGSAFAAFELLESRLPAGEKPAPLAARADALGNWGLVIGAPVADWRRAVRSDLAVALSVAGRAVVAQRGGHPAGDPFHPVVWLANALVARGGGLRAGQVVTTGALGGSHPLPAGAGARGEIEGFAPIAVEVAS